MKEALAIWAAICLGFLMTAATVGVIITSINVVSATGEVTGCYIQRSVDDYLVRGDIDWDFDRLIGVSRNPAEALQMLAAMCPKKPEAQQSMERQ